MIRFLFKPHRRLEQAFKDYDAKVLEKLAKTLFEDPKMLQILFECGTDPVSKEDAQKFYNQFKVIWATSNKKNINRGRLRHYTLTSLKKLQSMYNFDPEIPYGAF